MAAGQDKIQIAFKQVRQGSTTKCLNLLKQTIRDELKLMVDQIVSISIHESEVRHGDLEAVVFYRTRPSSDNSEPTESLEVQEFVRDEDTEWSEINKIVLLNANAPSKRVISVGSTFRNVGAEKVSVILSIDGENP